jgi:hypothetical protein
VILHVPSQMISSLPFAPLILSLPTHGMVCKLASLPSTALLFCIILHVFQSMPISHPLLVSSLDEVLSLVTKSMECHNLVVHITLENMMCLDCDQNVQLTPYLHCASNCLFYMMFYMSKLCLGWIDQANACDCGIETS